MNEEKDIDQEFAQLIGQFSGNETGVSALPDADGNNQNSVDAGIQAIPKELLDEEVNDTQSPALDSAGTQVIFDAHEDAQRELRRTVVIVATPIASTQSLVALLGLAGIDAAVVATSTGTLACLEIQAQVGDDIEALLGAERPAPPQAHELACELSRLARLGVVLFVSWLVEGAQIEPGVSGQITARRFVGGQPEQDLPAGLVVSQMDQRVEDILVGRVRASELVDSELDYPTSAWQALKMLGKNLRRGN